MERTTIQCRGRLVNLETPIVMGILNLTPDSFFDGSLYEKHYLERAEKMLEEGATIIDIGAMSSRPGSLVVEEDEERRRLIEPLKQIRRMFPHTVLSIDTLRATIAQEALDAGADIINDISAGNFDSGMGEVVAAHKAPYILMHMKGMPDHMQKDPVYEDVTQEVMQFFINKLEWFYEKGVKDIILDPGFGFGKNLSHNYQLLKSLSSFKLLDCPILAGISRKSMVNQVLKIGAKDALNGTTALHMLALEQGAKILRVHDVKEAVQCILLHQAYVKS